MRWPACGSARILMLLKRRWRSLPMCLATAWTGRSTSSRVARGTTACRSSSVTHVRTSVPKRPRPARSWARSVGDRLGVDEVTATLRG